MTTKLLSTTLLGFDYGRKRIGIAVGQMLTHSATPLMTIPTYNGKPDWVMLSRVIDEWKPGALVVGIPYHMDGTEQEMTKLALKFCRQLEGRYRLPVYHAEERLSSYLVEASTYSHFESGSDIDPLAAQVILQDWLQKAERK